MSAQAVGRVWERSTYSGARLVVLLAVADVVNDTYDHRFWMTVAELAKKARTSENTARTAMQAFVEDGWLEVVEGSRGRRPNEYRFSAPEVTLQSLEGTANPPIGEDEPSNLGDPTLQSDGSAPLSIPREPKGNPTRESRADSFAATWAIYPRKLNRKGAEKAWLARLGAGASVDDLHLATLNYAAIRKGHDPATTMHGTTFYGPHDRWADYLNPTEDTAPAPRRESVAVSKARRAIANVTRDQDRLAALELMEATG